MTIKVTIMVWVSNGDVEINAPGIMICVNVETKPFVLNKFPANIAAPAPAAHGAEARSRVPEARLTHNTPLGGGSRKGTNSI